MIKRVSLVRRHPDLSKEAFLEHWLGAHADIVRRPAGLLAACRFGGLARRLGRPSEAAERRGEQPGQAPHDVGVRAQPVLEERLLREIGVSPDEADPLDHRVSGSIHSQR